MTREPKPTADDLERDAETNAAANSEDPTLPKLIGPGHNWGRSFRQWIAAKFGRGSKQ